MYASIVGYSAVTGAQLLLTALNATDDRVSGGVFTPAQLTCRETLDGGQG